MDITTKDPRLGRAYDEIRQVLERYGLSRRDLSKLLWWDANHAHTQKSDDELWNSLCGMWKEKDIDPLKYQKEIREELERPLPPL